MIIESIIGVFFVSVLAYLYWKSIEGEMNEVLPTEKLTAKKEPEGVASVTPDEKPKRASRKADQVVVEDKVPAKQAKPKATKTTKPTAEASTDKPVKKPRARKPKMTVLK